MTTLVTTRPPAAEPLDFSFPEVRSWELPGVRLRAVHVPGRPKARLLVVSDAGAVAEDADALGVANLVADTLPRGAAGMGERELAIAFEMLGTAPGTGVAYDTARASLEAPGGMLARAAELLCEVVRRPALREEDVEDMRTSLVEEDRSTLTSPEAVAARVVRRELWADGCRYGEAATGTAETIGALTLDQVRDHHARRWAAQELVVVVVGDLDAVGDVEAIGRAFSGEASRPPAQAEVAVRSPERRVVLADRPGAAQSVLLLARPGPARGHEDAAALDVALAATCASFNSRLNMRLREELGYTYGARGGVTRRRHGGIFTASMSVRTEVTAEALRETVEVFRAATEDGLGEDEVTQARDNLVRRYPVQFDGNRAISGAVAELLTYDLEDDHHDRRLAELKAVTAEQATAALRRAVSVDDLVLGVVGDGAAVRGDLEGLGLGEVLDRQP